MADLTNRAGSSSPSEQRLTVIVAAGPGAGALDIARRWPQATTVSTRPTDIPPEVTCYSVAASGSAARAALQNAPSANHAVVDWDPRLRRYGAAQLNERYRRHSDREMNQDAWRGWMACKVAMEYALHLDTSDAPVPLTAMTFDGHKGRALTFSREHRHLVQPVYLVHTPEEGAPIEVPAHRGRAMRRRDALCTLLYCLVGTPLAGLARASQTQRPCASPRTQYVYVSNERGRSISVVNDTTRQVEATIAVPGRPRGIQLSADGRTLYVALSDEAELVQGEQDGLSDDVSVIDTTTLQVVGTVATGEGPWGIAVGP